MRQSIHNKTLLLLDLVEIAIYSFLFAIYDEHCGSRNIPSRFVVQNKTTKYEEETPYWLDSYTCVWLLFRQLFYSCRMQHPFLHIFTNNTPDAYTYLATCLQLIEVNEEKGMGYVRLTFIFITLHKQKVVVSCIPFSFYLLRFLFSIVRTAWHNEYFVCTAFIVY